MDDKIRIYTMQTASLEDPAVFEERLNEVSVSRREKIKRIRSRQEKRLSLASALLLNQGLFSYGLSGKDMDIRTGAHGKPYFADAPSIHFSLSHSGKLAMAAFSDAGIGCDIQIMKASPDEPRMTSIAERFFTERECAWISSSEIPLERKIRFYRLWVLKESYAKATGEGMGRTLKNCGFSMDPGPFLEGDKRDSFRFYEYSFGGYRSAVCLRAEI